MLHTHEDEEGPRPSERVRTRVEPAVEAARDRTRLGVLAEVGTLLASPDDHITILQRLPELAVPALADWCAVHITNALTGQLERIALRHADPSRVEMAELISRTTSADPDVRGAARVFATAQSELYERVPDDMFAHLAPAAQDAIRTLGLRSYIAVPLVVRGRVLGVLTLVRSETGTDYDRDDLAFAEELARRVAMFVDNAMLLREVQLREAALRDEATRLETLNRIGQELAAIHEPDDVVKRVCDAATQLTRAELGFAWTYADGEARYALCGATFEESQQVAERSRELSPSARSFALQRALRVDDVAHAVSAPDLGVLAGVKRIASYLAIPVRGRRGNVIGGIALGSSRQAAFDVRAEQLVCGLASLTATAIESARLFHEARELIGALEKSNRDLDQFAYVTSHDLRAPLRGIANLATWIEQDMADRLSDSSRTHLMLLQGRVRRLEDLIQGVLDYSRAGRVADAPVDIDLGELVREVIELLEVPSHVRIDIAPGLPTVHSTRVPLQQVFMNLIANALKYNTSEHPTITIGAEPIADGWELFVRDNGPGIPRRFHAQVWGLFQTLQSRDRVESTGIGLAIVRRIVEAHGGRAWIDSEEGQGATFRFTWPKDPPRIATWERDASKR